MFSLDLEASSRRREAEMARWVAAEQEKRKKEIRAMAEAVAEVEDFPVSAITNFYRQYGTLTEFSLIHNLSPSLTLPVSIFEGAIVVGTINEPDAIGSYRAGDFECDFESLDVAYGACPNVAVISLRECRTLEEERAIDEFVCLGLTDQDLNPPVTPPPMFEDFGTRPARHTRVAFFGTTKPPNTPTLPFQNLQRLILSGNVNIQQFTLSSQILREISIEQNMSLKKIGFARLPALEAIKLYRCPKLRSLKATSLPSLEVLEVTACQGIDLHKLEALVQDASPLKMLGWTDMFRHGAAARNLELMCDYIDFFKGVAKHTDSIVLQRFSVDGLGRCTDKLVPMRTVFDIALLEALSTSQTIQHLTIRGSNVFTALPLVCGPSIKSIDASSCKNLEQIGVYEKIGIGPSYEINEVSLEKLILNDCPRLTMLDGLTALSCLRVLHCQGCNLISNDIFPLLPEGIVELDLTACSKVGDLRDLECSGTFFAQLIWCSFKKTSIKASDIEKWIAVAPSLEYFNLGNLELSGMRLEAHSLKTLLLINADVSGPFTIKCPLLTQLWIGNGYRGWPYEQRQAQTRSRSIHGESLVASIKEADFYSGSLRVFASGTETQPPLPPTLQLQIYLPENFVLTLGGDAVLSFTTDTFWSSGTRPSTFNGPVHFCELINSRCKKLAVLQKTCSWRKDAPIAISTSRL